MIVEISYSDGNERKTTDPYEGATHIERDDEDNVVVTWDDGTRQTFINGRIEQMWDSFECHNVTGNE